MTPDQEQFLLSEGFLEIVRQHLVTNPNLLVIEIAFDETMGGPKIVKLSRPAVDEAWTILNGDVPIP